MLIERLQVKGLLSFGPDGIDLPLESLNVLIGPNGSGKSNLIEVLGLLRATASGNTAGFFSRTGEWDDLLWKGPPHIDCDVRAKASVVATVTMPKSDESIRYSLELFPPDGPPMKESIGRVNISGGTCIFVEVDSPHNSSELGCLHRQYGHMRLYRNWTFGALAPMRDGQGPHRLPWGPDGEESPDPIRGGLGAGLSENADNLAGVISQFSVSLKDRLTKYLDRFYEGVVGITTPFYDGKAWVEIEESGERRIPAARLSDGTLRYLFLLTVLLDPKPPPLIGIEEPELGLHPDVIYDLAELLVEAKERTQLVVTTHSRVLIDALTDYPSSVVACEKYEGQTRFKRVNQETMKVWLDEHSLGEVWSMGGIGGNRW